MMMTRRRNLLIIPVLLAAGIATMAAGPAAATAPSALPAGQVALDEDQAIDELGNGLVNCNGGVQEADLVRLNDMPTALVENAAFVTLTGATISFTTPAMDNDQILVKFSAEARLQGQAVTFTAPVDFVQIQILLDGAPMAPLNDLTFTTVAGEANATAACKRVPAGNHTVEVQWLLV